MSKGLFIPTGFVGGKSAFVAANPQGIPNAFDTNFTFANPVVLWDDDGLFQGAGGATAGFKIPASWAGKRVRVTVWVIWDTTNIGGFKQITVKRGQVNSVDWGTQQQQKTQSNVTFDMTKGLYVVNDLALNEIIGISGFQNTGFTVNATPRMMIEKLN